MSVGLDSEGLLAIYADWIAFLREKKGQFEGQLTKLQGKGHGKDKTPPASVVPSAAEPVPALSQEPAPPASPDTQTPDWFFETAPEALPEAALPGVSTTAPDEEGDDWM